MKLCIKCGYSNILLEQEGSLLLCYTLYTASEYDSKIQAAAEVIAALGKTYVTTAVIFFCLNCWVIGDQFQTIGDQVKKLSKNFPVINLADQLRILQNHHVLISYSVELLNESFGTILLLEMFFIFACFTNYLMKILVIFHTASTYSKISMVILLASITGNLALICSSAELIRSKVSSINCDAHHLSIS